MLDKISARINYKNREKKSKLFSKSYQSLIINNRNQMEFLLKNAQNKLSLMNQHMMENGKLEQINVMEREYVSGMMVVCMKDTGRMILLMAREEWCMPTVIYIMVNGKMIRHMGMENIRNQMVQSTMENGKMINKMAMESRSGLTDHILKDFTKMVLKKEKDISNGEMVHHMKAILVKTISMEKESIFGMMEEYIMDNGNLIKCMVKELSIGKMVVNMRVTTSKI